MAVLEKNPLDSLTNPGATNTQAPSPEASAPPPDEAAEYEDIIRLLQEGSSQPPSGAMAPTPPPLDDMQPDQQPQAAPSNVPGTTVSNGSPNLAERTWQRLIGSDVDDPLPFTRMGTTIGGSLGGAAAGASIPGPPMVKGIGGLVGSIAGAAGGAAAPEMTMEVLESMGILPPGTRAKTGLTDEQLATVVQGEALLEAAGLSVMGGARGIGRTIASLMTGTKGTGRAMAEDAARYGIAMMPVQVGQRAFARGYVSVMGGFPILTAGLKPGMRRSMEAIEGAFRSIPARFGPLATYDQASASILRDSSQYLEGVDRAYKTGFNDIVGRASMSGITVRPVSTRGATEQIMTAIERETPRGVRIHIDPITGNPVRNAPALKVTDGAIDVRRFINQTTRLLSDGTAIADQSMRQMATVLKTVDEKLVKYTNSADTDTINRFTQLRQAIANDMYRNTVGNGAQGFSREFQALDEEMTTGVNELLGYAVRNKMGIMSSPTMRGIRMTDAGTNVDGLAKSLLRGNSPGAVDEVAGLVHPSTMRELTSAVFREAIDDAQKVAGPDVIMDVNKFAENIGLNDRASGKFQQLERLLHHSGGMTVDELDRMVQIARTASSVQIPNVSSFVARRATMGGLASGVRAALPTSGFAAAGFAAAGIPGAAFNIMLAVGGSRLVGNIISNPASARALSRVFDQETSLTVKRAASMRAIEIGLGQGFSGASSEIQHIYLNAKEAWNALTNEVNKPK